MGVKERKARQKKFLRQEILDAASELFVKEGFENVSMRRIADKIEYSPTTIYLYFKDKAELLEQVCQETFARLITHLERILGQTGDPVERLRRGLLAYVQFGLENPHHYRAVFLMAIPDSFDKAKYKQPDAPSMQAFDFLRRCVLDCVNAERFRRQDAETISQTLWAGAHGVTSLLVVMTDGFPFVNRRELIESTINTMIAGLTKGTT